jgi:hypothetical protein
VTGQDFDLKMGSVDLSQGNLEISDGSTLTHDANYALTMRSLSVANGTYDLVDSAKLTTTAGLIVGSSSPGTFIWETANGKVVLNGQTMTINSNGTLDMLFGFDANALTTGSIFQGGGCLNISAGTLKIDNGATATQNATQTFSLGMLCVNDGTYYLDGNGTLSTSRGISVGTDGNSGLFEWHSGTISVGGNAMTVDANGTLAMDTNFSVNDLFSGSLFSGGGSLAISSGTLQVQNGATATVASGSAVPRVGNVYLTNGGLSFSSGSSGISVQNALILDGNSSLQSSDANNTLIVQPALGALAHSSIQIQSKDSNALSGLGGVTVKCQFDPNDANSVIIELEVAGRAYDPNLVDPNTGVDNNFSKSNFVINHLVVGNADSDANVGKHGVTLRLVNSCPNQSEDPNDDKAVYVGTLEMLRGSTIDPNGFHLYYLTSAGYPNKKKEFFLGDANLDGKVDGVDFLAWQSHYSTTIHSRTWSDADFNGDRTVDGVDFLIWQSHYPSNSLLMQSPKALSASAGSFSPSRQSIDLNGDGVISVDEAAKAFDNLPVGQ